MQTEDIDIDNEYFTQHRSENYENATPPILFFRANKNATTLTLAISKTSHRFLQYIITYTQLCIMNWCKDSIYFVAFMNLNQSHTVKNVFVR